MNPKIEILQYLVIWIITALIIVKGCLRQRATGSGLTLYFVLSYSLLYCVGAFVYLSPFHPEGVENLIVQGLRVSTLSFFGFCIGNTLIKHLFLSIFFSSKAKTPQEVTAIRHRKLAIWYFVIGFLFTFVLRGFFAQVPTLTTFLAFGLNLIVVGICLGCWEAIRTQNNKLLRRWYLAAVSLPLLTIVTMGFLGFGFSMFLIVNAFLWRFIKIKIKHIPFILLLVYLSMTFYQTYMRDRDRIRDAVWGGATMIEKVSVLQTTLSKPEFFNPLDVDQLLRISGRIDYNYISGVVVNYMQAGFVEHAGFDLMSHSLVSLVPRFLWPSKPIVAGGAAMATKYTGMRFAEETTIGLGLPVYFFIALGYPGVLIGFIVIGFIIALIDAKAGYYLSYNECSKFMIWFLPGLIIIGADSFSDLFSGTAAAFIFSYCIAKFA